MTAAEVLETFRTVAAAQARYGADAAGRYVISFTAEAGDVAPRPPARRGVRVGR